MSTPTAPIERETLYIHEAAALLGLAPKKVSDMLKDGSFPCQRALVEIAGRVRISRPALMRWLENPGAS